MALDQNAKYPVGTIPPTAAYPEGSAVNSTVSGALNGYPWEKDQINDRLGLEQALLRSSGQGASGIPDTALVSQYLKGIIELVQGRAYNYDDSGVADAYVLDVQANQQAPAGLFNTQRFKFIAGNTPTGPSTINVAGFGVKGLKNNDGNDLIANYFLAGDTVEGEYNLAADEFRIDRPIGGEHIKLSDVKASGTVGGTFTSGAWQTRDLNTEDADTGGNNALAANQFTLQPGTYEIHAQAPAYAVAAHQTRLYNITDAAVEILGTSSFSDVANVVFSRSFVIGQFTITAIKVFELQHQCGTTRASVGFGNPGSFGNEVYATVELKKVK